MQISSNKLNTLPTESSSSLFPQTNSKGKNKNSNNYSRLNTIVSEKMEKGFRYDKNLFHKTNFHLKPLNDNP